MMVAYAYVTHMLNMPSTNYDWDSSRLQIDTLI